MIIKCPECAVEYNNETILACKIEDTVCYKLGGKGYAEHKLKRVKFILHDNNLFECPDCECLFEWPNYKIIEKSPYFKEDNYDLQ